MPWGRRRPGWPVRHFGRRGVFLLVFGLTFIASGVSTLLVPADRFSRVPVFGPYLNSPWWGVMWIVAGSAAVIVGEARAHGHGDGPGFVALLIPPAVFTIFYLVNVFSYLLTGGVEGSIRSIAGAVTWSLVWLVVLLIAGWPDPTPPKADVAVDDPRDPGAV